MKTRGTSMQIRLSEDERILLQNAANRSGATFSSWSRMVLIREASKASEAAEVLKAMSAAETKTATTSKNNNS